jgi:hypothetical protein
MTLLLVLVLGVLLPSTVTSHTIVPKPLNQTTTNTVLNLNAHDFNFTATEKNSPLLQAAFTRYSEILLHAKRGLNSNSLADQRSLDWLLSSSLLSKTEYDELTARVLKKIQ